ncbi:type II CAAX prenyl endopeptidase Rce1 family protein [uncultured Clostridium sp.]|uniref:CPBP family glutamic-type intramembrane protease n=1 Tax=uncultured Clostridium sp. TaxID=59620 RepID=UPI003217EA68
MKSLFKEEVKVSRSLVAFLLLIIGFAILMMDNTPVSFFSVLLSGLIGSWFVFGFDGVKKIFSRPKKGAVKLILLSIVAAYAISIITGIISTYILHEAAATNAIKEQFNGNLLDSFTVLFKTIFMLAGEEILVTLPLLIFVSLLVHKTKISQSKAVMISTIVTAIIFGAIHLPTYQWNIFQCFLVVALTRIPFTIVSLKSDSIISGIIGHIVFDWMIFAGYIISQL